MLSSQFLVVNRCRSSLHDIIVHWQSALCAVVTLHIIRRIFTDVSLRRRSVSSSCVIMRLHHHTLSSRTVVVRHRHWCHHHMSSSYVGFACCCHPLYHQRALSCVVARCHRLTSSSSPCALLSSSDKADHYFLSKCLGKRCAICAWIKRYMLANIMHNFLTLFTAGLGLATKSPAPKRWCQIVPAPNRECANSSAQTSCSTWH